ncbi:MAG TPA: hypothetical protein VGG19_09905 [Tepidisphaeraceae bacterium]|jgi:hypothetical protein
MAMKGIVKAINPQRGMVAIQTDGNGYTIIELLANTDIHLGDEMAWENDTGLGSEIYLNRTQGRKMEVYVQNHWVNANQLRQQLLL